MFPLYIYELVFISLCIGLFFSSKPGYTIIYFMGLVMLFSILLFYLSLDFFAFSLFYIYIGGIVILFIFLIMMLGDYYPTFHRKESVSTVTWGTNLFISATFVVFLILCNYYFHDKQIVPITYISFYPAIFYYTDLLVLGTLLFNFFFIELFLVCLLLILAMLGPITMLFTDSTDTKTKQLAQFDSKATIKKLI